MNLETQTKNHPAIVGLGEVLWDLLPAGRQLGGAPANFAYHAGALGADARLVSRVGHDDLGQQAVQRLKALGVRTGGVEVDPVLPTGTVSVLLAPDGQPQFTIHEPVAWDAIAGSPAGREAVASADALCFGTLAQRREPSRTTLRTLVAAAPSTALRVFDINLRQHYYSARMIEESLQLADVLKVNDAELVRLAELLGLPGDEPSQIAELARRFDLQCVACTRGARGSLLFSQGLWSAHSGAPTTVADTIGAGDSFTAAMTLGLLAGWPLEQVHRCAAGLASYVCSQPGATPPLPKALTEAFRGVSAGSKASRPQP